MTRLSRIASAERCPCQRPRFSINSPGRVQSHEELDAAIRRFEQGISERALGKHISKSFIERQTLMMQMSIRRFTRLTNAFSKTWRTTQRPWRCIAYTTISHASTALCV
jgi:hypothetical protein